MKVKRMLIHLRSIIAVLALSISLPVHSQAELPDRKIRQAFKGLIAAENLHDENAVRALTWNSPSRSLWRRLLRDGATTGVSMP